MAEGKVILVSAEKGPKVRMADFTAIMHQLQEAIGGWIEVIYSANYVFAVDEDGGPKGLRINPYGELCSGRPIVGDFVILNYYNREFEPLTEEQVTGWFARMGIELPADDEEEE